MRDLFQNCFTPGRSVLGSTYDEAGNEIATDQELTSTTDTECNTINSAEYGKSCCPSDGDYSLDKINPDSDPEELNECAPVGTIER